jgi:hypothetical protein
VLDDALAPARRRVPSWAYRTGSVAIYFALTCWLYGVDLFSNSKVILAAGADQAQEVWFIGWPAYALTHFLNPFQSDFMNWPYGVNLMSNTSMPLLGFVAAPITWLFGPVAAYTLLMRFAFIASAASAQFVARRIGISRGPAIFAGLIYGFSTMQIAQGFGHLFLVFCALPPLVLYGVYCLAIGRWNARRGGITIGVLFAADFLVSAERSLMTAVVTFVCLVVAAIFCFRRITRDVLVRMALGALWAAGVTLAIVAIPVLAMQGHGHVNGTAHTWIQSYETDAVSVLNPTRFTWLHLWHFSFSPKLDAQIWENGAYIGIPLIVLVIFAIARGWRNRLALVGFVSTVVVLGMSMGEVIRNNGVKTTWHSPYKILTTIKYFENILPVRFMYFVWLGLALLGAFGIDLIIKGRRVPTHAGEVAARSSSRHTARVVSACAVVGLVAVSLAPARGYPMVPTIVPQWLTTQAARDAIPSNSVVLYYPYPLLISNHSLLNQASQGYPYKIIGGEAIVGDASGVNVGIQPLTPLALPSVFIRSFACLVNPPVGTPNCLKDGPIVPLHIYLPPMPALNAATIAQFRLFIVKNHVSTILMEQAQTPQAQYVLPYLTASFGQPMSENSGTLLVWTKSMLAAAVASR